MTPQQIWKETYSTARKLERENTRLGLGFTYSTYINKRRISIYEMDGEVKISFFKQYSAGFFREWFFYTLRNDPRTFRKPRVLRMARISSNQRGFKLP